MEEEDDYEGEWEEEVEYILETDSEESGDYSIGGEIGEDEEGEYEEWIEEIVEIVTDSGTDDQYEDEDEDEYDDQYDDQYSDEFEEEYTGPGEQDTDKPSKDEYKVAKWLRSNVKTKKTKFLSHNVEYFTANKALDALMKSKFAVGEKALFTTREQAIEYLDIMLEHKFYHRAKKVPVYPDELKLKGKSKDGKETAAQPTSTKKETKDEKAAVAEKITDIDSNVEGAAATSEENTKSKEKRKRKIRLDMHPEQIFVDGSEAYVWIYDPIPIHYWIYGLILLLGAIVVCLFPLWPPALRKGVYYLSVLAAGFLVFILALTIIRLIIFVIVWVLTGGKLHLWIFPNLTEDVGFLASFWPLYEKKYEADKGKQDKKLKKKKKDKDSDAEDDGEAPPLEPEKIENIKENDADILLRRRNVVQTENVDELDNNAETLRHSDAKESTTQSESESEGSRSSTGKDFEMVDPNDVET